MPPVFEFGMGMTGKDIVLQIAKVKHGLQKAEARMSTVSSVKASRKQLPVIANSLQEKSNSEFSNSATSSPSSSVAGIENVCKRVLRSHAKKYKIDQVTKRTCSDTLAKAEHSGEGASILKKRKKTKVEANVEYEVKESKESMVKNDIDSYLITNKFQAPLSIRIKTEYNKLAGQLEHLSASSRARKTIEFTGGSVSSTDLVAYQIGWGIRVIEWYEAGLKGEKITMPGDGFSTWSYEAMATHFYKKYKYDGGNEQDRVFHDVVNRILAIVEKEYVTGNLEAKGVWLWARLPSGKEWPLSKWVQVNTVAPYKRAADYIRKFVE